MDICKAAPLGEVCDDATARLAKQGSPRAAEAKAYGLTKKLEVAEDLAAIKALVDSTDPATLDSLAPSLKGFAVTAGALVAADAIASKRFATHPKSTRLDKSICIKRTGYNQIVEYRTAAKAAKAAGNTAERTANAEKMRKLQKKFFFANKLLETPEVATFVKTVRRMTRPKVDEASNAFSTITEATLRERLKTLYAEGKGMNAPCVLFDKLPRGLRGAP